MILKLPIWITAVWIIICSTVRPVFLIHRCTTAELLQLGVRAGEPPPDLHLHLDIVFLPHRKYVHCGSRRSYKIHSQSAILSFWSTNPRPPKKHTQTINHGVLTKLTKTACLSMGKNDLFFGLWNIGSLSNKGPFTYCLIINLIFFVCLR